MTSPLVRVGDLIRIPEADYRYGVGELHMRIIHVPRSAGIPGLEWVELVGVPIPHRGREDRPRPVLIRVAALRQPGRVTRLAPTGPDLTASGSDVSAAG